VCAEGAAATHEEFRALRHFERRRHETAVRLAIVKSGDTAFLLTADQEAGILHARRRDVTVSPTHWFVIRCGDSDLAVYRWNSETANATGARHYCGEAHAEVYISRWFESVCAPPKPNFI